MDTRRIALRFQVETRFTIQVRRHGAIERFEGWARDISESGMRAFVGRPLRMGETMTLTIPTTAAEQSFVLAAVVVRCVGTEYGFQFVTLSPEQREQIRSLVEGKAQMPV
jgi:c-di-GMP-binding flagellar brake protein YcgR